MLGDRGYQLLSCHSERKRRIQSWADSMATHAYWIYILTNRWNGTLYVGVTNDLKRRIWEHKTGAISGFTKQYGLKRLLYFEEFRAVHHAIDREKNLKGWNRQRKLEMIEKNNPDWRDLSVGWFDE